MTLACRARDDKFVLDTESYMKYTLQQHKFVRVFTYTHTKGPSAS